MGLLLTGGADAPLQLGPAEVRRCGSENQQVVKNQQLVRNQQEVKLAGAQQQQLVSTPSMRGKKHAGSCQPRAGSLSAVSPTQETQWGLPAIAPDRSHRQYHHHRRSSQTHLEQTAQPLLRRQRDQKYTSEQP